MLCIELFAVQTIVLQIKSRRRNCPCPGTKVRTLPRLLSSNGYFDVIASEKRAAQHHTVGMFVSKLVSKHDRLKKNASLVLPCYGHESIFYRFLKRFACKFKFIIISKEKYLLLSSHLFWIWSLSIRSLGHFIKKNDKKRDGKK